MALAALKDSFVSMVPENLAVFSLLRFRLCIHQPPHILTAALNRCLWEVLVMVTAVAMPLWGTSLNPFGEMINYCFSPLWIRTR